MCWQFLSVKQRCRHLGHLDRLDRAPASAPEVTPGDSAWWRGPDEPSDVQGAALKKVAAQPWRCLWRGFSQITMTRPWRRITLHLSQIFFTLGLTFIEKLSLRYELNVGDV
ncbi:hypothetical protein GCM10009725_13700 [Aeromicrobium tamlense]